MARIRHRGPGRPPAPEPRNHRVGVNLTAAEMARLRLYRASLARPRPTFARIAREALLAFLAAAGA